MDLLLREYVALINSPRDASAHLWELRKSEAVYDIATFVSQKTISFDDLSEFSEDLREAVESICSSRMSY